MTEDRLAGDRAAGGWWRVRSLLAGLALACALLLGLAAMSAARSRTARTSRSANPLDGRGMWIWYVSQAAGGNVSGIVATARRYGIRTLLIKSGDGSGTWSQFSPQLVSALHAAGLHVCGWQYVYGVHPQAEAQVGAYAVRAGADCLMIDAEGEYEGRYIAAQSYIRTLRSLIGADFPVALAGLPYVDYHPGFPYSVFLGPGGAQYNAPQMYWADIGTTVDSVYAHTYEFNSIYGRRIYPLGQVSGSPPSSQIRRFRQLSRAYGASNVSWWDWQEATASEWRALSRPVPSLSGYAAAASYARLGRGAQGDLVVWAQEHLRSAGYRITIDGAFGPGTEAAVKSFQQSHNLQTVGSIGPYTWQALLQYAPVAVTWTARGARVARAQVAGGRGALTLPLPRSASLPSRGNELHGAPGRG